MQKILWRSIMGLVTGFVVIQCIPVARNNPPVELDIPASPEVKTVLRRACYDCHSHETIWPWYSHIAPMAWLVERDVRNGRQKLNFSTWNRYSTKQQVKKLRESWREVAQQQMPPWLYTTPHPQARLSAADRLLLRDWALASAGAGASTSEQPEGREQRED